MQLLTGASRADHCETVTQAGVEAWRRNQHMSSAHIVGATGVQPPLLGEKKTEQSSQSEDRH